MAERTVAGQDFGNLAFSVRFKVLAPQEAKPRIPEVLDSCSLSLCCQLLGSIFRVCGKNLLG
jgi:hypothetical protein